MDISSFSALNNSFGSQYNFRSMTNLQFLDAVKNLGAQGKISKDDATQLSFIAQGVDSTPITGASPSVSQILSDPTQHDFISEISGDDYSAHGSGGSGAALYDQLLKVIQGLSTDT